MLQIGYQLATEEHAALDLVRYAARAEEVGFSFGFISDHYHPWIDRQGQSPFVWSVLGAMAEVTEQLPVATAVTCPTMRIHPAIVAQAAATVATMMPGRFSLGVGSGENLNEHILGDPWPAPDLRVEMIEEAIQVIRELWGGGMTTFRGLFYTVEKARIYSLPSELPPILVAASGSRSAQVAARHGDGLITVGPEPEVVRAFRENGGKGKPVYGQLHISWAENEAEARKTAHEYWPTAALGGTLFTEIQLPEHFEQVTELAREEDVAQSVRCASHAEPFLEAVRKFADAGYDAVCLHQVGPNQKEFLQFFERELSPILQQEQIVATS